MPAGAKQPVVVHYTEHCPPDVGAAFIWLKNRDPDRWRDVQNVEHVMGRYIISDKPMTAEQWAAERATVIDDVVEELPAPEGDFVTPELPSGIEQCKKGYYVPGPNRYFPGRQLKTHHVRSLSPRLRSGPRTVISQLRSCFRPGNVHCLDNREA
jgi:hypothetical protein